MRLTTFILSTWISSDHEPWCKVPHALWTLALQIKSTCSSHTVLFHEDRGCLPSLLLPRAEIVFSIPQCHDFHNWTVSNTGPRQRSQSRGNNKDPKQMLTEVGHARKPKQAKSRCVNSNAIQQSMKIQLKMYPQKLMDIFHIIGHQWQWFRWNSNPMKSSKNWL